MISEKQKKERNRAVKVLAYQKFGFILTPGQIEIIRKILFRESLRISLSAYTRYGKSQVVSIAIALIIQYNENIRIMFIGPKKEQAGILKRYMNELIMRDPDLFKLIPKFTRSQMDMNVEKSQKRLTFINGCEYEVFSAYHEANSLMGFGVGANGIIVVDEACLVGMRAYAKIMRMIGDDPENIMLIELYNPWDRDTKAFEHTEDPDYDVTNIGWKQGIDEGRTTQTYIDEMRHDMTDLDFTVLMESKFPEQSEDALYNLGKIKIAEDKKTDLYKVLLENIKIISNAQKHTEIEVKKAKEKIKDFKIIISCDPAEKGKDKDVIYWGVKGSSFWEIEGFNWEGISDPMKTVIRLIDTLEKNFLSCINIIPITFKIDPIAIGSGAVTRLKERIKEKRWKNVRVLSCHFGESAYTKYEKKQIKIGKMKKEFANKKAKFAFKLRDILREELISFPKERDIRKHLVAMKWERTSAEIKSIVDPKDYSPDFAHAMIYFTWEDKERLVYAFG